MEIDSRLKSLRIEEKEYFGDEIKLNEVIEKYTHYWKWFVLGLVLAVSLAYIKLRYTPDLYKASSTILIDNKESGGISTELSAFEDINMFGKSKSSLSNEIGILQSHTLMEKVIKNLGINITYYHKGKFLNNELYKSQIPFKINFFIKDSILHKSNFNFTIKAISKTSFLIQIGKEGDENFFLKKSVFGKNLSIGFGEINVVPTYLDNINLEETIIVKISAVKNVVSKYLNAVEIIEPDNVKSSLLFLNLVDPSKQKAKDILNNIIKQYNDDAIAYKSELTNSTNNFINKRINDIYKELNLVDKGVEDFKKSNKLTNIDYESQLVLSSNSQLESKIVNLNSQIRLIDYVSSYLKENRIDLIPTNLGLNNESINQTTSMFNILLMERNRIIKNSSEKNPAVINLDEQMETLRRSIEQSLENFKSSLEFSLNEARMQESRLNFRKTRAPQQERVFQDIKREQQTIESLYLYLLQKREENAISFGATSPNAKVIDRAFGSDISISPNRKKIYLLAGFLGMFFPFLIIAIYTFFDNKIHTVEQVEQVVKAPLLGDIPKTKSKQKIVVTDKLNDSIAESFRLLRTNINFMLTSNNGLGKAIFVTSTIGGEGKSFITINLASAMASINKRVIVIGADLRKPKLDKYLNIKLPKKGLLNFLINNELNIEEIIIKNDSNNFDYIPSGEIPPNPSELLMNGRFEILISKLKENYDFILVDTPPVNLVTDTLQISKYADLFIYVIRANYLDKRLLKIPKTMFESKRLPNMALLVNYTDRNRKEYGYGYGYGYGEIIDEKPWWKKYN